MAVPAFGAAGTGAVTTGTSLSVPYPASITSGQLLVLHIFQWTSSVADPTTPADWTLQQQATAQSSTCFVYTKTATGSESGNLSVTVTSSGDGHYGRMYRFTGDSGTWGFETGNSTNGTGGSISVPSVTTSGADREAICLVNIKDSTKDILSPTGESGGDWVEAVAEYETSTGSNACLGILRADMASSGTISGGSFDQGGIADPWLCISFAVYVNSAITGSAAITEASDTLSGASTLAVAGSASITEAADTLSAAGALAITGEAAISEADDTLSAAGTMGQPITGAADITEDSDTISAAATLAIAGTATITEADDTVAATSALAITGAATIAEADDTLAATGALAIAGLADITEGDDTVSAESAVSGGHETNRGGAGGSAGRSSKPRAIIVHFVEDELPTETPPTETVAPTTPYPGRKAKKAKAAQPVRPANLNEDEEEEALIMLLAA